MRSLLIVAACGVATAIDKGEFKEMPGSKFKFGMEKIGVQKTTPPHEMLKSEELPSEFSWADKDGVSYLTKNLNQHIPQYCGSCWAHGATSAFGDRVKIQRGGKGIDVNLSIQFILNCGTEVAGSCYGGSHLSAYEFIHDYGYIPFDSANPYSACSKDSKAGFCGNANWECTPVNIARTCNTFPEMGGKCVGLNHFPHATISEYGAVSGADNMKKEIFARGPIACGINADPLRAYPGGVLDLPDEAKDIDHVISVYGWGVDEKTGNEYWRIRNSWGEFWGEMGHLRLKMGENQLGIEAQCAFAVPGDVTEHNFPCAEDGANCKPDSESEVIVV